MKLRMVLALIGHRGRMSRSAARDGRYIFIVDATLDSQVERITFGNIA
jgi:hypothetical protein